MKNYRFNMNDLIVLFFSIFILSLFNCHSQNHKEYIVLPLKEKPIIDAVLDSIWLSIPIESVEGDIIGDLNRSGDDDLSVNFRCGHYNDTLFFFIDIIDDIRSYYGDTLITKYQNDMFQLFFAEGNKKLAAKEMTKTDSIFQLIFFYGQHREDTTKWCRYAQTDTPKGYCFEIEMPIIKSTYDRKSKKIGFNIEIRDNDNILDPAGGVISGVETYLNWAHKGVMLFWQKTEYYGDLILKSK